MIGRRQRVIHPPKGRIRIPKPRPSRYVEIREPGPSWFAVSISPAGPFQSVGGERRSYREALILAADIRSGTDWQVRDVEPNG